MQIGDRIRKLRKMRGMKLHEVRDLCGISISYLSDLENNRAQNPTADTLLKLAKIYGVSIENIVGGENSLDLTVDELELLYYWRNQQYGGVLNLVADKLNGSTS